MTKGFATMLIKQ